MSEQSPRVFTVGHSTHAMNDFVGLVRRHDITAIADVRSVPFSRFNPQFNRDPLSRSLRVHGIEYVFLGRELGARPDDRSCYENGRVQYDRLARTQLFRAGLERVLAGAEKHRIALMCSEKEPLECHRTLLVARALDEHGVDIQHILDGGSLEPHAAAMDRLRAMFGLANDELLRTRDMLVLDALALQEERIAYVNEDMTAQSASKAR